MASLIHQNGRFYLQFFDSERAPKRKKVALHVTVKRDAAPVRRKLEADYAVGRFDPWSDNPLTYDRQPAGPHAPRTVDDAVPLFLRAKGHLRPSTQKQYREVVERFAAHAGGGLRVRDLRARHVTAWLDSTDAGDVTRRTYVRHLRAFLRWCRKAGATDTVATDGVALRKTPRTFARYLSPGEVDHLVRTIREEARSAHWLADLVVFAVHTGLRRGEIVNLTWEAIDLDRRVLTVANTADFQTKSGGDRRVPLSGTAVDVLRRRAALADPSVPYVWTHSRGKIRPDYLSEAFKRYARKAGLDGVHLHHTRHTACSWLAQRGVPVEAIRKFAGHSSITVTERYMHLSDDVYARQVTGALGG